jgi:hypothetical protein
MLSALDDGEKYGMILRAKGMVDASDGQWLYFDYVPDSDKGRGLRTVVRGGHGHTGALRGQDWCSIKAIMCTPEVQGVLCSGPLRHGLLRQGHHVPSASWPRDEGLRQYKNRDWIEVTARMAVEEAPRIQGQGSGDEQVVSVGPCEKPKDEVVTF